MAGFGRPMTTNSIPRRSSTHHGGRRTKRVSGLGNMVTTMEELGPRPHTVQQRERRRTTERGVFPNMADFTGLNLRLEYDEAFFGSEEKRLLLPKAIGTLSPGLFRQQSNAGVSIEGENRLSLLAARCLLNCLQKDRRNFASFESGMYSGNYVAEVETCSGDKSECMGGVAGERLKNDHREIGGYSSSPASKQSKQETTDYVRPASPKRRSSLGRPRKPSALMGTKQRRKFSVSEEEGVDSSTKDVNGSTNSNSNSNTRIRKPRNSRRRLSWRKAKLPEKTTAGSTVPNIATKLADNGDEGPRTPPKVLLPGCEQVVALPSQKSRGPAQAVAGVSAKLGELGAATIGIGLIHDVSPLHQELGVQIIVDGMNGSTVNSTRGSHSRYGFLLTFCVPSRGLYRDLTCVIPVGRFWYLKAACPAMLCKRPNGLDLLVSLW